MRHEATATCLSWIPPTAVEGTLSVPFALRTVADVVFDVRAPADAQGWERFAVFGARAAARTRRPAPP